MLKSAKPLTLIAALVIAAGPALGGNLGLGREASPAEVSAWDIDIRPDGQGLPEGSGTVARGEELFQERCTVCHGDFGEGAGRWPVLAGGFDTLDSEFPVKTIGSYWPKLSTVFDYIRRAMPFGDAQSLTADETYALTALLLYLNEVVDEDFELTKENFTSIKLGNESGFIPDDRPDTPGLSEREPCMTDCKSEVVIRQRAGVLDVTPNADDASATTSD